MSVRYRPICPQQAWRSQLAHSLTSVERFGEIYLLTNPAANSIGCYPLIPRLAAAEVGMSTEEMQNVISRLEEMSIAVLQDGYILVRTWFFHSTWESTLTGNVLKSALADIRKMPHQLHPQWRDASVEAGVPESVVEKTMEEALSSPFQAPCERLNNTTKTKQTGNQKPNTTTTTPPPLAPAFALDLLPCAEPHRDTLSALGAARGLSQTQIQELGWELSARLHAAVHGNGKHIGLVDRWLATFPLCQDSCRPG